MMPSKYMSNKNRTKNSKGNRTKNISKTLNYDRFFVKCRLRTFFDDLKPTYLPSGLGNFIRMKLTKKKVIKLIQVNNIVIR
jgi:hypothetical protein